MRSNKLVTSIKRTVEASNRYDNLKWTSGCRYLSSVVPQSMEYEFGNDHQSMDVKVTQTLSPQSKKIHLQRNESTVSSVSSVSSDDTALVDSLLRKTSTLIETSGSNIIAFSGGVDSSLAAALVHRVFHNVGSDTIDNGDLKAVIGVSSSLPQRQLDLARSVASQIDIELMEVKTTEGSDTTYIANEGKACFICKNHLYSALEAVANAATEFSNRDKKRKVALFNGTNADDTRDPTRLGLLSAKSFSVRSPLIDISKDEVRRAAKHLNLPNWNYAASPCLRSRLALGVEATENHLKAVNMAEERVRKVLTLDETVNMRVRMLSGQRAMVELDKDLIYNEKQSGQSIEEMLRDEGFEEFCRDLGFLGGVGVRAFKTGSISMKE